MKKLLFVMQSLYNGGAEKSLVNLLNELPENKYEVDLLLFRQEGMFLSQVPKWVRILKTPDTLRLLYSPLRRAGKYKGMKLLGQSGHALQKEIFAVQLRIGGCIHIADGLRK